MKQLYPDIRPYHTEMLDTDDGHQLYLELSGTSGGIPVIVLHGGPGAGCSSKMRCFFDPERYQIIVFDQRGAGRSKPHADIVNNSVSLILQDMELIRRHLNINTWVLFGGSFGATLALLYAQAFPQQVTGMILRGVFLGRQQDLDWLYKQGAGRFFPEEWQRFTSVVDGATGDQLIEQYHQLLQGANELAAVSAAKAWARWEISNSSFKSAQGSQGDAMETHAALSMARISAHFFKHKCFLKENQILANAAKIADIPGYIVHGRYDMICPAEQAWALAEKWPQAELDLVREAGHSGFDSAIVDALIRSTNKMAKRLGQPDSKA